MRIRSIKPEFWRSDDIDALEWDTRLIFIGLWSYVDDNGVGLDKLASICADLFASDLERDTRETFARVSRGLQTLFERGQIARYAVDGKDYLHIVNWDRHQKIDRPAKPRHPLPTSENAAIRDTLARHSRDIRETPSTGTGEQGNRGTGEIPTAAAYETTDRTRDAEQPRGPAVDPSGWKLVRDTIPAEHPQSVRTDLAIRAGTLLKSGTPPADVRDALTLWLTKSHLGPGALPSLVSEVVRNRTQPAPGITTDGAATAKARGWLAVGEELDHASRIHANAAVPQRNPTAIAACTYCDEAGWRTPPPELRDTDPPVAKCDHQPGMPAAWRTLIARLLDAPDTQKAIRS